MKILAIIPARYSSSRFPGKPLALIHGVPMIERVVQQVMKCGEVEQVVVATDDERISAVVTGFGGTAVMTSANHQSGTERCAEVVSLMGEPFDVVLNVQGDEPFIQPKQIALLCSCFENPEAGIATLMKKTTRYEELIDTNTVKIVPSVQQTALYFSRSVIPFYRNAPQQHWGGLARYYKHIGLYAFRKEILQQIALLPATEPEKAESLEQLRWLSHGFRIHLAETDEESISIDTPEDLLRAEKQYPPH